MTSRLDPARTFDTLVVGPGNRLAAAAAGRSAEAPGTYNPLVIHGPAGTGKTHLLHALGQRALATRPRLRLVLEGMDSFVDRLSGALAQDRLESFRKECLGIDLLLLDGAEVLCGRVDIQNELLPIWDRMGQSGGQVVLASALPPAQIDALHLRLESRFARVLAVEIQPPTQETRTSMLLRGNGRSHDGLSPLAPPARPHIDQDHFGAPPPRTTPGPYAVPPVPGEAAPAAPADDEDPFGSFLDDITATLEEVVDGAPWRNAVGEAIMRWGGEGMRTWRLEQMLDGGDVPDVTEVIGVYEADCTRLLEIAAELARIAPSTAGSTVLRDPDRLAEAEALLFGARLEQRPLPPPPPGLTLARFVGRGGMETGAVQLARRIVAGEAGNGAPLLVHGPADRCTHYLGAIGNAAAEARPGGIAYLRGSDAADELSGALEAGFPELWRRRYEAASLFLLDGLEALLVDARLQESLAGLITALLANRARVVVAAGEPLRRLEGVDPRLASRFSAAEQVDVGGASPRRLLNGRESAAPARVRAADATLSGPDRWFMDREKIAWDWTALEDRLVEEYV
jgi:chromosomal replication initiation ATPase DnaA